MLLPDSFVDEWILALAAILIALGVIWKFGYATYKAVHRIDQTLGVDAKGRTISERLDRVEYQLFPNGGNSLVDRVNQIAFDQRTIEGELRVVKDYMGLVKSDDKV
jgi:hypothetical protein